MYIISLQTGIQDTYIHLQYSTITTATMQQINYENLQFMPVVISIKFHTYIGVNWSIKQIRFQIQFGTMKLGIVLGNVSPIEIHGEHLFSIHRHGSDTYAKLFIHRIKKVGPVLCTYSAVSLDKNWTKNLCRSPLKYFNACTHICMYYRYLHG